MPTDAGPQPPVLDAVASITATLRRITEAYATFARDVAEAALIAEYNRRLAHGLEPQTCHCLCVIAHRDHRGVCLGEVDKHDLVTFTLGRHVVPMCAPCATAHAATEPRRRWRLNTKTTVLGPDDAVPLGRLTAEEVKRQQMPPCPSCGATIELDWLDVHTSDDRTPMYVPGAWQCPNGCDIRALHKEDAE